MKCPVCNIDLVMSERSGVEIDYCPECRGIWLDRGELDKIIERSEIYPPVHKPEVNTHTETPKAFFGGDDHHHNEDKEQHNDQPNYQKKKKESFLGDLFDF